MAAKVGRRFLFLFCFVVCLVICLFVCFLPPCRTVFNIMIPHAILYRAADVPSHLEVHFPRRYQPKCKNHGTDWFGFVDSVETTSALCLNGWVHIQEPISYLQKSCKENKTISNQHSGILVIF